MADQQIPSPSPPPPSPISAPPTPPSAIWSLILGILSFLCGGFLTAIPAIICGHVARSSIRKASGALGGAGMAMAGLVLGYVALVLNLILIPAIVIPIVLKARQEIHSKANASSELGNLKEMVAADGTSRISVPDNWKEMPELHEAASLEAGNRATDEYLIVLTEAKADLNDYTLEKHHEKTRTSTVGNLVNGSAGETASLTINGHPALQEEIRGTSDNVNVVFLHTTVDDGKYFHQILAWTVKSQWEAKKARLQAIVGGFRPAG